jgi:restriction system protein
MLWGPSLVRPVILKQLPLPDYQTCMLPLLQYLRDGQERSVREMEGALADRFQLKG